GKGSTAAMLACIAQAAGYRTGLYTSPHLNRVNERIQINGCPISDEDFARLYFRVDETAARLVENGRVQNDQVPNPSQPLAKGGMEATLPQHPSFFETITAVAFLYFAEQKVELAVLEVGIGGRLDATNIVEPLVSVITDISLDHMEWLGDTITAIAREKAGILRPHGALITLPQHPEANQAIGESATALGVKGINAVEYMPAAHSDTHSAAEDAWHAAYIVPILGEPTEIAPPLPGSHQFRNTALAIAAACELRNSHGYKFKPEQIARGIRDTRWPGRLEQFPATASRCAVLLDVAHNPAGAWSLRSALSGLPATGPRTLLFGCLRDKAVEEMAQILFPIFDRVVITAVDSPRTAAADDLLAAAQKVGAAVTSASSPQAALQAALDQTPSDGLLVCAGSVYLVGAVRGHLAMEPKP
ncbi:MAG: folylpolyglutamate synthase/dihydrofolate synthase family protein, partial [Acidobacteriaceae bacterium]